MTSQYMYYDSSKNGAFSANFDSNISFDIRNFVDQLTPNPKEKGKYICPACNGHNLSINLKTGKFNCWNCGDTKAIARHLAGDDNHTRWQKQLNQQLDQYVAQKKAAQQQRQTQAELKREHPDLSDAEIEYASALINNPLTAIELDPAEKLKSDIQAYLLEKDPYAKAKIRVAILRNHGLSREILDNLIIETAIGSQSKRFNKFQGMDFLESDLEPVQFLVQGVPIGGTTILAGSSGSGKTTLAYWLGKCVLDGNEFLGDAPSTTGGVFIVNSDEGIHTAHDRVVDMDYPADNRWMFLSNFKLDYHFEELEELIRDRQPKLLIVDSFCGIHGQAFEENSSIAGITVEKFNRLAETYNCAIVMIHHLNKAGELRGSSRIKDTAHSVLLIEENKDGTREYKSKKIRCASTFEYTLKQDYEGIPIICQGGESKMHLNIKEIILGCLQASMKPLEPAEIVEITLLSKQQVWDGLKKLRDTGKAKCRRSQRDKRAKVWMPTTATTHTHTPSDDESSKFSETITQQAIEPEKNILDPSSNLIDPSTNSSIPNEGSSIQIEQSSIESSIVNPIQGEEESEITRPHPETIDESEGTNEVKSQKSKVKNQKSNTSGLTLDSSDEQVNEVPLKEAAEPDTFDLTLDTSDLKPDPITEFYSLKAGDFIFGSNKLFQLKEKQLNVWLTVQGVYVSYADWLAGSYRQPTSNDVKFLLCQATDKLQLEFLVKHFQSVVIGQLLEELPQSVSEQILDLDFDA